MKTIMGQRSLADYFAFRSMVSYELIRVIYAIGLVLITGMGVYLTLLDTWAQAFIGFSMLIFGNLGWRVSCELMIVLFSAHERLCEIRSELQARDGRA